MGAGPSSKLGDDERSAPMLDNAHGSVAISIITQARVAKHERMSPAYQMIITSAAVLGGFAINAAVDDIRETDFGNQAAFEVYAVNLVASSVLDLYAMVTLVVNIYAAARAHALSSSELLELEALGVAGDVAAVNASLARLEQRTARWRAEFEYRSRFYRYTAIVAFVVSLPCFLGALAAKQFSLQPKRHGHAPLSLNAQLVASADQAAPPSSTPVPPASVPLDAEPFTPIRWSLAILVLIGTFAVLLSVIGQMRLLRMVRGTL